MSNQFGEYGAGAQQQALTINLDFGLEETGGLAGQKPPVGIHTWQVVNFEGKMTGNSEMALVLDLQIVHSGVTGATGITTTEWLVFPGEVRKQNDRKSWEAMMKMTRLKLEAITGRPWRENRMQLNASEIAGKKFVARVYHVDETYEKDGEKVTTTKAKLTDWAAVQQGAGGNGTLGDTMSGWGTPAAAAPPAAPQVAQAAGWGQPAGPVTTQPPMQQEPTPPTSPVQQSEQPAGAGFAFANQPNQQEPPPAAAQPGQVYDPAEEPF